VHPAKSVIPIPRRSPQQAHQERAVAGSPRAPRSRRTTDGKTLRTTATYLDRGLVGDLINNGVKFDVKPREEPSFLMSILVSWGPMLLLIGVWIYFMRQMQGGGKGGAFSFGKSRRACSTRPTTPPPSPTSPAATRPRKRSRNWSTS
jgi:ATP-dependent Zn protease